MAEYISQLYIINCSFNCIGHFDIRIKKSKVYLGLELVSHNTYKVKQEN